MMCGNKALQYWQGAIIFFAVLLMRYYFLLVDVSTFMYGLWFSNTIGNIFFMLGIINCV